MIRKLLINNNLVKPMFKPNYSNRNFSNTNNETNKQILTTLNGIESKLETIFIFGSLPYGYFLGYLITDIIKLIKLIQQ